MNGSTNNSPEFSHIDIERLLQLLFIEASKKGMHWTSKCPSGLHNDRNPSWTVRDEPGSKRNGTHHCFSCKFGGTAVDLVQHILGLTPSGAAQFIAERAMREIHPALAVRFQIKSPVRRSCSLPAGVYFEPLSDWIQTARAYVTGRGITEEQVSKWRLGYAVDGLLMGRFIIPTYDRNNRLVNWTARTFLNDPKRYLMASSQNNPDKDAIFGEQYWPSDVKNAVLVLTEGALNAMAVERVSNLPIGALSGSHLEPGHAMKLSRFGGVIICTDPDLAGDDAANKLEAMLGRHLRVARLRLPEGTDCNSIAASELAERICSVRETMRGN